MTELIAYRMPATPTARLDMPSTIHRGKPRIPGFTPERSAGNPQQRGHVPALILLRAQKSSLRLSHCKSAT